MYQRMKRACFSVLKGMKLEGRANYFKIYHK